MLNLTDTFSGIYYEEVKKNRSFIICESNDSIFGEKDALNFISNFSNSFNISLLIIRFERVYLSLVLINSIENHQQFSIRVILKSHCLE